MPGKPPTYEELEDALQKRPADVLSRLPDSTEARSAKRHLDLAYGYDLESREKVKPE
jgi:hypothetical protein